MNKNAIGNIKSGLVKIEEIAIENHESGLEILGLTFPL